MYSDCIEGKYFEETNGIKYKKWIRKHGKVYKIHWVENGIEYSKFQFPNELLAREELMYGLGRFVRADIYKP